MGSHTTYPATPPNKISFIASWVLFINHRVSSRGKPIRIAGLEMTLLGMLLRREGVTARPETRLSGSPPARLGAETKRAKERRPICHGGGVCGDWAGCMIDLRQVGVAEGGNTDTAMIQPWIMPG